MGKYIVLMTVAVAALAASGVSAAEKPAASAPASKPTTRAVEYAAKLMPEIQAVAKLDAPGADGFAAALAGVLKKHSLAVPDVLLAAAKPSATLPKLTKEQLDTYSSQTVTDLFADISRLSRNFRIEVYAVSLDPGERDLRVDLLEAFCRYAPSMTLRFRAAERLLTLATPSGDEGPQPPPPLDAHRAVEDAAAAVTEGLAAAKDGRDTVSMKALAGGRLADVPLQMIVLDLMTLDDITPEALDKARKPWLARLAAWEKDAPEESRQALASIRKFITEPLPDVVVDAIRRAKPVSTQTAKPRRADG